MRHSMTLRRRKLTFLLVVLLTISILASGCGKSNSDQVDGTGPELAEKQEITLNLGDEPSNLDPQLVSDIVPMKVVGAVFEGLYRKDKNGIPAPAVAESCDVSGDGLTYTFHLRGALWADGAPVTAGDFKTAWMRALNPKPLTYQPSPMGNLLYYIKGAAQYNSSEGAADDVGIAVKDDKTLVVTLAEATPYFIDVICNAVFMPVQQSFYNKQPVENNTTKYGSEAGTIIGNGPFAIKEWNHDESLVLIKNPKYWNSKEIKLETVTFKMIKNASSAFTAFKAGELDMAEITDDSQITETENMNATVQSYDTGSTFFAGFNNADQYMKNVNIRKALAYAIDRDSVTRKVLKDGSEKALGFVNPVVYGEKDFFRKEAGDLFKDNNVAEAKTLLTKGLQELGITELPKLKLVGEDTETSKRDCQIFQDMWKNNLGVDVDIQLMGFDAMIEKLAGGEYQITLLSWAGDYNDPVAFLDALYSKSEFNVYKYSNTAYDGLVSQSKAELDKGKRMQLLKDAEKMMLDDMAICPLYFARYSYAVNPVVKGFVRKNSPIQDIDLYWTYIGV